MNLNAFVDFSRNAREVFSSQNEDDSASRIPNIPLTSPGAEMAVAILFASSLSNRLPVEHPVDLQRHSDYSIFERMIESQSHMMDAGIQRDTIPGIPHRKPVEGTMTREFHPGHPGVDTRLESGTTIFSTMDGEVVFAGWNYEGYGHLVVIQNGKYATYYAHLSSYLVQVGELVTAGTRIGRSGNSGNSGGPHLHYEVRVNGKPEDPSKYYGKRLSITH
jgi:murein DD-endopeptidase MepM/ murein hydrolase activator NlpD